MVKHVLAQLERMFYRACESQAAVYDNKNGLSNRSAMEKPPSGGIAYVIMVSPVPGKYA